jgi:hypothetical protein
METLTCRIIYYSAYNLFVDALLNSSCIKYEMTPLEVFCPYIHQKRNIFRTEFCMT